MDLKAFFKENAEVAQNQHVVISERFKDDKGKPIKWEIRPLSEEKVDEIRKSCTQRVKIKIPGGGARFTDEIDSNALSAKMIIESVVYPNLKSIELQKSYNVAEAPALLKKMLLVGEHTNLAKKVYEISGIDDDFDELVDEAKN